MKKLELSVIIPTRNRLDATIRTLLSLTFQTLDQDLFEVIVVDDGSIRDTFHILKKLTHRLGFRIIKNKDQGSAACARNVGWRKSDGNIVVFLDCDMIADPKLIEMHLDYHGKPNSDRDVVLGYRFLTVESVEYPSFKNLNEIQDWAFSIQLLPDEREKFWRSQSKVYYKQKADWGCLYSHNISLRKSLIEQVGGFDDNFGGCGGEDVELGYRLFKISSNFIIGRKAIGYHQYHPRSPERWKSNFSNIEKIAIKHPELSWFKNKVLSEWRVANNTDHESQTIKTRQIRDLLQ